MRSYSLMVGTNVLDIMTFGINNPTGLGIRFNISFYSNALSTSIPNIIEVFNCDEKYYKNAKSYIGSPILFNAGFDKSVLCIKSRYKNVSSSLLLTGTITNIVPNFSDLLNPSVLFSVSGSFKKYDKSAGPYKKEILQLKGPLLNGAKIALWLQKFLPPLFLVKPSLKALQVPFLSESTINLSANSLDEALQQIEALGFTGTLSMNILTLDYEEDLGEGLSSSILGKIVAQASPLFPSISLEDIIGQPQIINTSELQVTTRLRPEFKVGDVVSLPSNSLKMSISSLNFSSINSLKSDMQIFTGGSFRVIGINHIGDSRNADPNSWITSFRLVPLV